MKRENLLLLGFVGILVLGLVMKKRKKLVEGFNSDDFGTYKATNGLTFKFEANEATINGSSMISVPGVDNTWQKGLIYYKFTKVPPTTLTAPTTLTVTTANSWDPNIVTDTYPVTKEVSSPQELIIVTPSSTWEDASADRTHYIKSDVTGQIISYDNAPVLVDTDKNYRLYDTNGIKLTIEIDNSNLKVKVGTGPEVTYNKVQSQKCSEYVCPPTYETKDDVNTTSCVQPDCLTSCCKTITDITFKCAEVTCTSGNRKKSPLPPCATTGCPKATDCCESIPIETTTEATPFLPISGEWIGKEGTDHAEFPFTTDAQGEPDKWYGIDVKKGEDGTYTSNDIVLTIVKDGDNLKINGELYEKTGNIPSGSSPSGIGLPMGTFSGTIGENAITIVINDNSGATVTIWGVSKNKISTITDKYVYEWGDNQYHELRKIDENTIDMYYNTEKDAVFSHLLTRLTKAGVTATPATSTCTDVKPEGWDAAWTCAGIVSWNKAKCTDGSIPTGKCDLSCGRCTTTSTTPAPSGLPKTCTDKCPVGQDLCAMDGYHCTGTVATEGAWCVPTGTCPSGTVGKAGTQGASATIPAPSGSASGSGTTPPAPSTVIAGSSPPPANELANLTATLNAQIEADRKASDQKFEDLMEALKEKEAEPATPTEEEGMSKNTKIAIGVAGGVIVIVLFIALVSGMRRPPPRTTQIQQPRPLMRQQSMRQLPMLPVRRL